MESQSTLSLTGPRADIEPFATLFDARFGDEGLPQSMFETEPEAGDASPWCFSLVVPTEASDEWIDRLTLLAQEKDIEADVEREDHGEIDWVSMTLRELTPVRAGRFTVHGSHDAPPHGVSVEVDAGLAFGTGHHGTTAGCLHLLERVVRRSSPRRILDVGTGSAVLAIAAAKALHRPVLASDIDRTAVKVARENVRTNGMDAFVRCIHATGFEHPAFSRFGKADLVLANILAGPLKRLARPMRDHLAAGASVILSGLLPHQAASVIATYRAQDLALERVHLQDGWASLLLRYRTHEKGGA